MSTELLLVTYKHQTDKAIKVEYDGEEIWIPKSVIEDDLTGFDQEVELEIEVQEWWLKKQSLL